MGVDTVAGIPCLYFYLAHSAWAVSLVPCWWSKVLRGTQGIFLVTFSCWLKRIQMLPELPGRSSQWDLDCSRTRGSSCSCLTGVALWFPRQLSNHLGWSTWAAGSREKPHSNAEWVVKRGHSHFPPAISLNWFYFSHSYFINKENLRNKICFLSELPCWGCGLCQMPLVCPDSVGLDPEVRKSTQVWDEAKKICTTVNKNPWK